MRTLINLVGRLTGAGKLLGYLNGAKTYLGGGALMLSGAAQVLTELTALHDLAGVLDWIKALPHDPGIASIAAGLVAVGLRHAIEKQASDQPAV